MNTRNYWIQTIGFALASLALYETGFLFFLFLVPMQLLSEKYGFQTFIIGAILVLIAIGVVGLLRTSPLTGQQEIRRFLLTLEFAFPIFFFLGLGVINWEWKKPIRGLYRLLLAAVVCGVVSVPFFLIISGNETVREFGKKQFSLIAEMVQNAILQEGSEAEVLINTETLVTTIMESLLRNYLFITFMIISLNWHMGRVLASRFFRQSGTFSAARSSGDGNTTSDGGDAGRTAYPVVREPLTTKNILLRFSVPDRLVWALLISWAGILLDSVVDLKFFGYLVWNAGLIMMFIYGLQGIGIIRYLFGKYNTPGGIRILFGVVFVILLFWPGLNLIVMIGVPLLGVSEIWIKYRKNGKISKENRS